MESLFDIWAKRDPKWEKKYAPMIEMFANYGEGVNSNQGFRGKIFGAGYEVYILAFFIGLYCDRTKPLVEDKAKIKKFGPHISEWGNKEARLGRYPYSQLQEYMFAALIVRTNVDFIALDKGNLSTREVVDMMMDKMDQYANFGFNYMQEKLEENPNYFFKETAFLRVFLDFLKKDEKQTEIDIDDEPDSLD